jgi:hypothetical protein
MGGTIRAICQNLESLTCIKIKDQFADHFEI